MFKGPELCTMCSWTLNGYQVAVGRLKELSVVAANGTAKAVHLISGLGNSYALFLILHFCLSLLVLCTELGMWLWFRNIYLMALIIWNRIERLLRKIVVSENVILGLNVLHLGNLKNNGKLDGK